VALEAVEKRGLLRETVFSSFYDSVLRDLRSHATDARVALLISPRAPQRWLERAQALGAEAVNPERSLVNEALVEEAHRAGLAVYVYTVDPEREMERLLGLGVDGLFTNVPDRMRRLLAGRS
jgi:glycerophosphoryl diester phosphodiesterase